MFKKLTDQVSVTGQITLDDINEAAKLDIKRIIMNRPDREEPGQPDTDALKAEAEKHGIDWIDIPVVAGGFTPDAVATMQSALSDAPGKILAFCRTGTRSCFLWALAQAIEGTLDADTISEKAMAAGYDLSPLKSRLEHLASAKSN